MRCINCDGKLSENVGYYSTDSGPLCITCHDLEIEADQRKLLNNFKKFSHRKNIKKKDETDQG